MAGLLGCLSNPEVTERLRNVSFPTRGALGSSA